MGGGHLSRAVFSAFFRRDSTRLKTTQNDSIYALFKPYFWPNLLKFHDLKRLLQVHF